MRIRQRKIRFENRRKAKENTPDELCIRTLEAEDAQQVLEHLKTAYGETDYLTKYADEADMTVEGERAFLEQMEKEERALMLGGFLDGELAVVASVLPISSRDKLRHRGGLGMCVKKKYWGLGIGRMLLTTLMEEAKQAGFEQIELEVISENERAVRLYESCGFERYGVRHKGIKLRGGGYFDEVLMWKELEKSGGCSAG